MKFFKFLYFILIFININLILIWLKFQLEKPALARNIFEKQIQRDKFFSINCSRIFENDKIEVEKAIREIKSKKHIALISDSNFIFKKDKCAIFSKIRAYFSNFISKEELEFPLAFSILTYQHAEQFERFLKSIYRPHNIYCVHVDKKSSPEFTAAIESITACFENVFVASKLEYVVYAGFSRLRADLNCAQDLLKRSSNWKYFINTASTEFPLRTNFEMVQIIKLLNGSNLINTIELTKQTESRYKFLYKENLNKYRMNRQISSKNNKAPHGIKLTKGSAYNIVQRNFLEEIFISKKIADFIKWLKKTYSPDEFFWASLETNQFLIDSNATKRITEQIIRKIIWKGSKHKCKGFYRHSICVYSIGDLAFLNKCKHIFANKFLLSHDPLSYQCMEERLINRTYSKQNQILIDKNFFLSYFKN